jgi:hypothetical protein
MTARITKSRAHRQWPQGRGFFNARKKDQVFEIKAKRLLGSFLGEPASPYKFAWENDSKALAFCAARSHIVAVR